MKYSFKYKLFGDNVRMFSEQNMGVVIEKDSHVVCVYGTDDKHQNIFCAIPFCHPKSLKGAEYTIEFCDNACVKIEVKDFKMIIDFENRKCAINKEIECYGSEIWGRDVQVEWSSFK